MIRSPYPATLVASLVACFIGGQSAAGHPIKTWRDAPQTESYLNPPYQDLVLRNRSNFDAFTHAQYHIERKEYGEAESILAELLADANLSPDDRAMTHQTFAYLYADQENYEGAINAFKDSLTVKDGDKPALPKAQQHQTLYNIAQLCMIIEDYRSAVVMFERWEQEIGEVSATARSLMATAYYQAGATDVALGQIRQAIAESPEPRETWYQLETAILLESDRIGEAILAFRIQFPEGAVEPATCQREKEIAAHAAATGVPFDRSPGCRP